MGRGKIIKIAVTLFLLIISIICGVFINYNSVINKPLKSQSETVTITVESGEAFNSLLTRLDNQGILRNITYIKINGKLNKQNYNIIPGSYEVNSDISLTDLLNVLETEDLKKNQVKVTIPEGYNIEKMADYLEKEGIFAKSDFISSVKNCSLPEYIKKDSNKKYNLEGYLYPDTYYLDKDAKPDELIKMMISSFDKAINQIKDETKIEIKNEDIEKIITKASLVEKEVRIDSERKIVASVIENRIKKGMKLEFCSTINYIIGYEKVVLYNSDLTVDSPYNTYKYKGLPVGPISSPGIESIKAVLQPDTTDYLYFVLTEDDKSHHFSKTLEEHEAAKKDAEAKRKAK